MACIIVTKIKEYINPKTEWEGMPVRWRRWSKYVTNYGKNLRQIVKLRL